MGSHQMRKALCSWIEWKALRWEKLWGHPGAHSHRTGPHPREAEGQSRRLEDGSSRGEGATGTCRCLQRLGKAGSGFLRIRCLTLSRRGAHCRAGTGTIHGVEGIPCSFLLKVRKGNEGEVDENLPHLIRHLPRPHGGIMLDGDTDTFVPKTSETTISTLSLQPRRWRGEKRKETTRSTWKIGL